MCYGFMSVRLSDTSWCPIKMAKRHVITCTVLHNSPWTLVFCCKGSRQNFNLSRAWNAVGVDWNWRVLTSISETVQDWEMEDIGWFYHDTSELMMLVEEQSHPDVMWFEVTAEQMEDQQYKAHMCAFVCLSVCLCVCVVVVVHVVCVCVCTVLWHANVVPTDCIVQWCQVRLMHPSDDTFMLVSQCWLLAKKRPSDENWLL